MQKVTVNKQESLIAEVTGRRLTKRQLLSTLICRIRVRKINFKRGVTGRT